MTYPKSGELAPRDREYRRRLAESLIANLGTAGAVDCAREFQWEGVLAEILTLSRWPERPHGHERT